MLVPEKLGIQLPLLGNEGKLVLQVSLRSRRKGRLKEEPNVPRALLQRVQLQEPVNRMQIAKLKCRWHEGVETFLVWGIHGIALSRNPW